MLFVGTYPNGACKGLTTTIPEIVTKKMDLWFIYLKLICVLSKIKLVTNSSAVRRRSKGHFSTISSAVHGTAPCYTAGSLRLPGPDVRRYGTDCHGPTAWPASSADPGERGLLCGAGKQAVSDPKQIDFPPTGKHRWRKSPRTLRGFETAVGPATDGKLEALRRRRDSQRAAGHPGMKKK